MSAQFILRYVCLYYSVYCIDSTSKKYARYVFQNVHTKISWNWISAFIRISCIDIGTEFIGRGIWFTSSITMATTRSHQSSIRWVCRNISNENNTIALCAIFGEQTHKNVIFNVVFVMDTVNNLYSYLLNFDLCRCTVGEPSGQQAYYSSSQKCDRSRSNRESDRCYYVSSILNKNNEINANDEILSIAETQFGQTANDRMVAWLVTRAQNYEHKWQLKWLCLHY